MSKPLSDKPVVLSAILLSEVLEKTLDLTNHHVYGNRDKLRDLLVMCHNNLGGLLEVKPHVAE